MHVEAGERRDFLPAFAEALVRAGAEQVLIEEGTGSGMGLSTAEYAGPRIEVGTYEDCLAADLVVVIRCPEDEVLVGMRPGTVLMAMLHYRTRPDRATLLDELGVRAFSLDAIVDDAGRRQVEVLEMVAWNGVQAAFHEIALRHPGFAHPSRRPLRVTCLGSGAVGGLAVHAATRYGDPALREELVSKSVPGVEVTVVDFDLTWHEDYMLDRLERTDLLIDATHRRTPQLPVVPNAWLAALPHDAVILDLAGDPYDPTAVPPLVKGVEGIPHGDLDQWVFRADDPAFDRVPVPAANRRLALSCRAWPGLRPRECMEVYGSQIEPFASLLLSRPSLDLDVEHGTYEERALARGEVKTWLAHAT